jgi:hypothetical protein
VSPALAAAVLKRPSVASIEAMLQKVGSRILTLVAEADEIDGGEDPAAVVAAEKAVADAKDERRVLAAALLAAQIAAKKVRQEAEAARKEEKRVAHVALAEKEKPLCIEALVTVARLLGRLQSICDTLPGPDAGAFHPTLLVEAANRIAAKNTKPKVAPAEDVHGRKYDLVVDTRLREVRLDLQCPATDVD